MKFLVKKLYEKDFYTLASPVSTLTFMSSAYIVVKADWLLYKPLRIAPLTNLDVRKFLEV